MRSELAALVRDVRQWIQNHYEVAETVSVRSAPPHRPSPVEKKPLLKKEETAPPPAKPLRTTRSSTLIEGWELQPLPTLLPSLSTHNWRTKLELHVKTCEPLIGALLIMPTEGPIHFFLDSVARAITRTFGAALIISLQEIPHYRSRVILSPLELIKEKFPKAQIHEVIKEGQQQWIVLNSLDSYSDNVDNKRALWRAIQLSFQSL